MGRENLISWLCFPCTQEPHELVAASVAARGKLLAAHTEHQRRSAGLGSWKGISRGWLRQSTTRQLLQLKFLQSQSMGAHVVAYWRNRLGQSPRNQGGTRLWNLQSLRGRGRHRLCFKGPKCSIELLNACKKHSIWGVLGRVGGDDRFTVHFLPPFILQVISVLFKVDVKSKKKY